MLEETVVGFGLEYQTEETTFNNINNNDMVYY